MKNFFNSLLDLIYRKKCYFCGNSKQSIKMCDECYEKLDFSEFKANRIIDGVDIYCAGIYTKELQKLIRGLKYHRQKDLAYFQAKFMYEYFSKIFDKKENFLIIPVPMHKKRFKQRKYNHMDLVADELSKLTGWKVNTKLIQRIKETKPQYKLNTKEREENLKNAFKVTKENYNGEKLLLIDDILTTGSTLTEIIKTLNKEGITNIVGLTTSCVYGSSVNIQ